MGTRNITRVIVDGKVAVEQYCQWDGYPTGQGYVVMNFVKQYCNGDALAEFKRRIKKSSLTMATSRNSTYTGAPSTETVSKLSKMEFESGTYDEKWWSRYVDDGTLTKEEVSEYIVATRNTGPLVLTYLMEYEPEGMTFYTHEYLHGIGNDLDWQIEGMFVINLDEETVSINWHGDIHAYKFSVVQKMTEDGINEEMKRIEEMEEQE